MTKQQKLKQDFVPDETKKVIKGGKFLKKLWCCVGGRV